MGIFTPIRLDHLQSALTDVFTGALEDQVPTPDVYWGLTEPTDAQLSGSKVSLRMIAGPSPFIRSRKRGSLLNPSTSIDVTVDSVIVGQRYGLLLNGFLYFTDAVGGDTLTTIRDRLSLTVSGDFLEPVTPSDVGADALRLTADFNGAMRELTLVGPMTASANVVSSQSVGVVKGSNTMLVNVRAFSKNREPWNGAPMLAQICFAALQSESYVETLTRNGVAVQNKGTPTDLSAVFGGRWEMNQSFDLTLAMHAAFVEDVDRIESLSLTSTFSGISTQQVITAA